MATRNIGETQAPAARFIKQQETLLKRLDQLGVKTNNFEEVLPTNFIDATLSGIARTVKAVLAAKNSGEISKHKQTINKINDALEVRRKKRANADWEAGYSGATEYYPEVAGRQYAKEK
jgi:hypothetical protein